MDPATNTPDRKTGPTNGTGNSLIAQPGLYLYGLLEPAGRKVQEEVRNRT